MKTIMLKRIIILNLLLFFTFILYSKTLDNSLNQVIEKYASKNLLNGSILIAQGDSILAKGAFGTKNIENKTNNTDSTLYSIASLTKQFTSAAILILAEDNKLSLTDKIGAYLNVPASMKSIQITNLLNHTSGIPDFWNYNISTDSIYEFLCRQDALEFTTGTEFRYCNSGYYLLGEIIEKVSGESFNSYLNKKIFEPLGMKNTFLYQGEELDRAIAYNPDWSINDFLITTANGGMMSTIEDMYKWDKALMEDKLLTKGSKESIFEPTVLISGDVINQGFGWQISDDNKNIVSHTGWLAAFGAYNQVDLENGYFIIILSNQIRPELMDLINEVNGVIYSVQ